MTILTGSEYIMMWERYSDVKSKTKENYRTAYRRLDQYLQKVGYEGELDFDKFECDSEMIHFDPIESTFIDDFIEHLIEDGASDAILSNTISAVRSLFAFLKGMNLIKRNPLVYYKNPYCKDTISNRWVTKDEAEKLLQAAYRIDPFLKQKYLLIFLLLNTGLRNQETRELMIDQIDLEGNTLYVTRGQKTSAGSVRLSNELTRELQAYILHPHNQVRFEQGNTYLFTKSNGNKLKTNKDLNKWIKEICHAADVEPVTAHWFRHTMAHLMLQEGVSPRIIQRQLRHKLLETTLRYLGVVVFEEMLEE